VTDADKHIDASLRIAAEYERRMNEAIRNNDSYGVMRFARMAGACRDIANHIAVLERDKELELPESD
jgi:hypothetical protein